MQRGLQTPSKGLHRRALTSTSNRTTAHEPGASSDTDSCRGVIKSLFFSFTIRWHTQPALSMAATAMERPAKAARCSGESCWGGVPASRERDLPCGPHDGQVDVSAAVIGAHL